MARPLREDAPVQVLREKNGWYYVRSGIEGWVAGQYVELQD